MDITHSAISKDIHLLTTTSNHLEFNKAYNNLENLIKTCPKICYELNITDGGLEREKLRFYRDKALTIEALFIKLVKNK